MFAKAVAGIGQCWYNGRRKSGKGEAMEFTVVRSPEEGMPYLDRLKAAGLLAVDTETTGLDAHRDQLRLVQIGAAGIPVLLIDCVPFLEDSRGRAFLKEVLEGDSAKIFHNAKFDLQFLRGEGILPENIRDTMLAAELLRPCGGPRKVSLSSVASHYLGVSLDKTEQTGDWSGALSDSQLAYAALDSRILLQLWDCLSDRLRENRLERIADIEFACAPALARAEYDGISLDLGQWERLCTDIQSQYEKALQALYAYSGEPSCQLTLWGGEEALDVNFDSNAYVLKLLKKNGIQVSSTSRYSLAPYHNHPLVKALTDYRKYAKLLSGFLHPLPAQIHPVTGRLHPKYGQIGAYSGRMCCWGPNIQQIPRETRFRSCFRAPEGRTLVLADYSQIELRVAAQISGDVRMKSAYTKGEDLHRLTASLVSDTLPEKVTAAQRQAAKAVNFGLIFGMGAAGLQQYAAQSYGVDMTMEEAVKFRDAFFRAYAGISWWHHDLKAGHFTEGRTMTGRKFLFTPRSGVSELANTPVQGTAADILKRALGLLYHEIREKDWKLVGIVHDEILLEVPAQEGANAARCLKAVMERAGTDILPSVPCVADAKTADSWAAK